MSDGGSHPYEPGGEPRPNARGRMMQICARCDAPSNSPAHRIAERVAVTARHRLRVVEPVLETPRQLLLLAYALDEIQDLDLGPDAWRIRLRAQALRDALPPDIPRAVGAPRLAELDGSTVSMPAPVRDEPAPRAPAPIVGDELPPPIVLIEHRPVSERARARALSKRIADKASRELATRAIAAGYRLRHTSGGHWILERPGQSDRLTLPANSGGPGYQRGWKNLRAHARRLGIDTEGL